jgi:hypothetical protein
VNPRKPIAIVEKTTAAYPKSGLLENTGMTIETMPMAGRIKIYTSGWPKNQKRCCHNRAVPPSAVL